jgi:hypothetical protein
MYAETLEQTQYRTPLNFENQIYSFTFIQLPIILFDKNTYRVPSGKIVGRIYVDTAHVLKILFWLQYPEIYLLLNPDFTSM